MDTIGLLSGLVGGLLSLGYFLLFAWILGRTRWGRHQTWLELKGSTLWAILALLVVASSPIFIIVGQRLVAYITHLFTG